MSNEYKFMSSFVMSFIETRVGKRKENNKKCGVACVCVVEEQGGDRSRGYEQCEAKQTKASVCVCALGSKLNGLCHGHE